MFNVVCTEQLHVNNPGQPHSSFYESFLWLIPAMSHHVFSVNALLLAFVFSFSIQQVPDNPIPHFLP